MATGDDSNVQVGLEMPVDPALRNIRAVVTELKNVIGDAERIEKAFEKAFGPLVGGQQNLRQLRQAISLLRMGGPEAGLSNAAMAGFGSRLQATNDRQLARALQEYLKHSQELGKIPELREKVARSRENTLLRTLGLRPDELKSGEARTAYEKMFNGLLNERDRALKKTSKERQQEFNELLGVRPPSIRKGNDRTAYEKAFARLLDDRDRALKKTTAERQREFNELLGVRPPSVRQGNDRTAYENAFGRLLDVRDRALRKTSKERQQEFNELLGVRPPSRLQGNERTAYENAFGRLLDVRDNALRKTAKQRQQEFNELLGVRPPNRLEGNERTAYENVFGRLLDVRDRTLEKTAKQRQQAFNELLGVRPPTVLEGSSRTAYENAFARLLNDRDKALQKTTSANAKAVEDNQKRFNELLGVRPPEIKEGKDRLSYETMWGKLLDTEAKAKARRIHTHDPWKYVTQKEFFERISGVRNTAQLEGMARVQYENLWGKLLNQQDRAREREEKKRQREREQAERSARRRSGETAREAREASLFGDGGAHIFSIQARLLAQYKVISTAYQSSAYLNNFIVELDRALHQLQAISGATSTEMETLAAQLIKVSEASKFTAVEIANASVTLAQAGFTSMEIAEAIDGIARLATSTGSTLEESVDLTSSVIHVFNMRAGETAHIADQVTSALNLSKLSVDKLSLGIQYAGNIAAESNVSFSELTAALAVMSNAGIRSGSTMGTGLRQMMLDLQAPTEKLKVRLRELGLSVQDVDAHSKGIIGVLKNLRAAGFSTGDAMEYFEVRAGAAYAALAGRVDDMEDFQQAMLLSNDTVRANAAQMEGLSNKWMNFSSVAGSVYNNLTKGLVQVLKDLIDASTVLFQWLNKLGPALTIFGTVAGGAVVGALSKWLIGLTGVNLAMQTAAKTVPALAGAAASMAGIARFMGPIGTAAGIGAFAVTVASGLGAFVTTADKAARRMEELQTEINKSREAADSKQTTLESLDKAMADVVARSANLTKGSDALKTAVLEAERRFGEFGLRIDRTDMSVNSLIASYQNLRNELARGLDIEFLSMALKLREQAELAETTGRAAASKVDPFKPLYDLGLIKAPSASPFPFSAGWGRAALAPDILTVEQKRQAAIEQLEPRLGGVARVLANTAEASQEDISAAARDVLAVMRDNEQNRESRAYKAAEILLKPLMELTKSLRDAEKSRTLAEMADRGAVKANFESRYGSRITDIFNRAEGVRRRFESGEIAEATTRDGKKIATENARAAVNSVLAEFDDFKAGLSPADLTTFEELYKDRVTTLSQTMNRHVKTAIEEAAKEDEKNLDTRLKLINDEIALEMRKVNDRAEPNEVAAVRDRLFREGGLLDQQAKLKRAVNALETRNYAPDTAARQAAILEAQIAQDREETELKIGEYFERLEEVAADILDISVSVRKRMEAIEKQYETRIREIEMPRRLHDLQTSALDLELNRNNVSDVEREHRARISEQLETAEIGQKAQAANEHIAKLREEINRIHVAGTEKQFRKDELEFQLGERLLSPEREQALKKERDKLESDLERLATEGASAWEKLGQAIIDADELQAEFISRTKEYQPTNLTSGIGMAFTSWANSVNLFKSSLASAIDGVRDLFDGMHTGIKEAVIAFAKGTGSMGDAFQAFAGRVIDGLLDIAATQAANGIMGLLGSFLPSFGPQMAYSAPIGPTMPSAPFQGLPAFSASGGGPVRGNVPGRDTVDAKLMPGEFVVRKTAVDMVGMDFMHKLNAGGLDAAAPMVNVMAPANNNEPREPLNIWVVTPDQVPPPSDKDIIAAVGNNIRNNGSLKKMIKQVQMGV